MLSLFRVAKQHAPEYTYYTFEAQVCFQGHPEASLSKIYRTMPTHGAEASAMPNGKQGRCTVLSVLLPMFYRSRIRQYHLVEGKF